MSAGGVTLEQAATPPGMRLYAIGDIHGCADLLKRMHDTISDEIARDRPDDWRVILLGDYVDRGPDSARTLEMIVNMIEADPRHIALCGNHDERFEAFLDDPSIADLFLQYGGDGTAASYGVTMATASADALAACHRALNEAVPHAHRALLRSLPRSASFGDFFFCHAGIRPGVPLEAQDPHDLIWIRRPFLDSDALHPKLIVHGHSPVDQPEIKPNRVNLDTRAFSSGRLSALMMDGTEKRIVAVQA